MNSPGAAARIELRRIPAQENVDKLLDDIKYIFVLIDKLRTEVSKKQQERLQNKKQ
jgi:hypothetical protein